MKEVMAADLFCGAGGASTALQQACDRIGRRLNLLAINHWPIAVETHSRNHPDARHMCASIEHVDPRVAVPGGRLHLLMAAPECTNHSRARGGRPIHDQSRSTAWSIPKWAQELFIDHILIENVEEFTTWGPLDMKGRPIEAKKGDTFRAFVGVLESMGYRVEWRVLNAADYGDHTTRRRLFIQARRVRGRIQWPTPTHSREGQHTLTGTTDRWRPARDVVDQALPSRSVFGRKKPLSPKTMDRVWDGMEKFSAPALRPFLVILRNNCSAQSLDAPLPTITASGQHLGLVQPFVLQQQSGGAPRGLDLPLPAIATAGAQALVQPFLTSYYGNGGSTSIGDPVPTVTTRDRFALVQPHLEGRALDIHLRMLQPHELAAAMGFPADYSFAGNAGDRVRQIGNAWAVGMGEALAGAILGEPP